MNKYECVYRFYECVYREFRLGEVENVGRLLNNFPFGKKKLCCDHIYDYVSNSGDERIGADKLNEFARRTA